MNVCVLDDVVNGKEPFPMSEEQKFLFCIVSHFNYEDYFTYMNALLNGDTKVVLDTYKMVVKRENLKEKFPMVKWDLLKE